jgi:hypothetical protein
VSLKFVEEIVVLGVQSRHLMGWIESKSVRIVLPAFADEFVGGESGEGFESFGEVVRDDEVVEVSF